MNWFARMDFSEQYQIEDAASDKRCDDKSNSKETYRRCFINSTNVYYPLANEVAKGYSKATVRPYFRNILVNTLESTSFNGF